MYLYLVRHGQSVGNERRLFFGWSDHPLTELGREQARQAGVAPPRQQQRAQRQPAKAHQPEGCQQNG